MQLLILLKIAKTYICVCSCLNTYTKITRTIQVLLRISGTLMGCQSRICGWMPHQASNFCSDIPLALAHPFPLWASPWT